ncbi:YkvA family protein [Nodosilinea nodulosa]|uniref:YkvA family protein n=1 Tax=Nodosilinea nodulosa TaxID=416001 RepID=UPI0002D4FE85|nr:YkvA family protein [Nodosilinea nodulosa]
MAKQFFGKPFMNWYRKLLRNSKYRWVVLFGTLVYLVSPIDISPDVFPVLGWIDDGLVATIAITEITQILLDRKRSLRQVDESITRAEATDIHETVIDVDSVAVL